MPDPNFNNAAIGAITRRKLWALVAADKLDPASVELLDAVLEHTRPTSPCGFVFLLAEALGAPLEIALEAGSFADLYCAAINLTDDLQDGDAGRYLCGVPPALQVNLCAQLVCLTASAAGELASDLGEPWGSRLVRRAFASGARMLTGQRIELLRQGWSVTAYERVARLSGGGEFEILLEAAAAAARQDSATLLPLAEPLGILTQVLHDERSRDPRLCCLPELERDRLREAAIEELTRGLRGVPNNARPLVDILCQSTITAGHGVS